MPKIPQSTVTPKTPVTTGRKRGKLTPTQQPFAKTSNGRTAKVTPPQNIKRYLINKQTGPHSITKHGNKINKNGLQLYEAKSKIQGAGQGVFSNKNFQPNELIGLLHGDPAYALDLQNGTSILFTIKNGDVHILNSLTHIIWADSASKQLTTNSETHKLTYGVHVESLLRFMNCSSTPNVTVRSFIVPRSVQKKIETESVEHYILNTKAPFKKSIALAAVANSSIAPNEELLLDYSPDGEDFDFEHMDNYPVPKLSVRDTEVLLNIARTLDPDSSQLTSGTNWLVNPQDTIQDRLQKPQESNPQSPPVIYVDDTPEEEQHNPSFQGKKLPSGFQCRVLLHDIYKKKL